MTDHTALIETKYTGKTLKRYTYFYIFSVEMNMLAYSEVFLQTRFQPTHKPLLGIEQSNFTFIIVKHK